MESTGAISAVIGMRAKIVTQALDEIGRRALPAESVVVGERGTERRCGHAERGRGRHHPPPGALCARDRFLEVLGKQQVAQAWVLLVGGADAVEEAGTDDAAPTPDRGHGAEIDTPAVVVG